MPAVRRRHELAGAAWPVVHRNHQTRTHDATRLDSTRHDTMNAASAEPVALSRSQFSPAASAVYPPAAKHNTAVIGSLATVSCLPLPPPPALHSAPLSSSV